MKIYACPKCGSKNIHVGTMDSGVTYGITSWDYTCKDCDYKGMPFIFYSEKEYQQFLKGLLKEVQSRIKKTSTDKKTDTKLEKEDREIISFIKELIDKESKEKNHIDKKEKPKWHKNRSWWLEIILAFIISGIIIIIFGVSISLFNYDANTVGYLIYLTIEFFIQAIIILAIIVVVEYFVLFKFIKKN